MTGNRGDVQGTPKNHGVSTGSVTFPRPRRPSHPRSISIQDIKDRLHASHIEVLCRAWLPNGKKQGGWWLACTPWREDRNPSLGVSLSTGRWQDFTTLEKGDMLDLSMKLFGGTLAETIKGFAEMLGMDRE
jgi:DNA primase